MVTKLHKAMKTILEQVEDIRRDRQAPPPSTPGRGDDMSNEEGGEHSADEGDGSGDDDNDEQCV